MSKCEVCQTERDEFGICDWYCPVIIAEDDQLRAEAAEAIAQPDDDPEMTQRMIEVARETLALIRFRKLVQNCP